VSVEDDKLWGQPVIGKTTENVGEFENSSTKTIAEQSRARRHHWDQLWSLPGDLNRKSEHAPYCSITITRSPTRPWKPQSLWLSFPILPTRRICFPNWKWNWRDDILKVSDIPRESQAVLDGIEENGFHGAFEAWKKKRHRCIRSQGDYM
jgi:hypothetical protein